MVPRTPKNNAWLIARKRQMQLAVSFSLDMGAGCTLKMLGQAAGIHHINALCFQVRNKHECWRYILLLLGCRLGMMLVVTIQLAGVS